MAGSTLASLFIALGLKTEGVSAGAKTATTEIEQIGTKGSVAAAGLGTSLGGLQSKLAETGIVGKAASGAIGVGLGLVGFQAIQMGVQFVSGMFSAERAQASLDAQTNAVIASTKDASTVTLDWAKSYAEQLSETTGASEEVVQSSENMLMTFTQIQNKVGAGNDIFNQATSTVLDMSQALGEDSKNAAIQLGKALNDPIAGATALQRVGVKLTETQKEQIATFVHSGDIMSAQKVILGELATEFGGSAKAFGDSAAGTSEKFANAVTQLQKAVGSVLLPVLNAILVPLTFMLQHMEILGPILAGIAAIILSVVVPAIWGMVAALFAADAAAAPITLAMLALGAAVAAAVWAFNSFKIVRDIVANVFGFITSVVKGFVGTLLAVAGAIVGVIAAIPGPLQDGAKSAQKTLDDMRHSVDAWGTETTPAAADAGTQVGTALGDSVATSTGESMAKGLEQQAPTIRKAAKDAADAAALAFENTFQGIKGNARVMGGQAMKSFSDGLKAERQAPLDALSALHNDLKHQLTITQEEHRLRGELSNSDLAKGLKSKDPDVYAEAVATKKLITDRLTELQHGSTIAGGLVASNLKDSIALGLSSGNPITGTWSMHIVSQNGSSAGGSSSAATTSSKGALKPKAFDIGAWDVPENQLAMVHAGEMILTARQAGLVRAGGGVPQVVAGATPSGGGGGLIVHSHLYLDGRQIAEHQDRSGYSQGAIYSEPTLHASSER